MLSAFRSALATPDLRKKILFTLAIVAVYRIGATIPAPGVSFAAVQACTAQADQQGVYQLLNLFSGGALLQLSLFATGIMPYITASIIVQLLTVVIPRFEELKKEGQSGQNKLTQYTRYLTIALAILQATGVVALADRGTLFQGCSQPIIPDNSIYSLTLIVVTMTAGTAVMMWLGELITERGVGNGMSVLIFLNIAARIPAEGANIISNGGGVALVVVLAFGLVIIASVIFVEQGQRRIPVQYAKRMVGRRMYGGTSTYLPIKVNQAGVIPVIFASSLLYLPQLLSQLIGDPNSNAGWQSFIQNYLVNQSSWVHILLYFLLIIFFTYFYITITFNVDERAEEMKKFGGFIPGIRPGRPTAEYLSFVLGRITLPGSLYLGIIAILPNFFLSLTGSGNNQNFPFGGTAVLIMVGVGLDTVKQIESQLMQRNYEGFLK
ncbi:preprotein translocase subunit SecY [Amycolatopsis rubida]|uniref:Protein translocase subunit SecY n=1 Tax=Amycolatopsis rubida TaxID=112413 RepID=A0A1I5D2Y8_9PSEU|nr:MULTISPECIES: preprotein translocase subunit SecY [Amycolatopsis]MYW93142.1 preprotein translocase subunit SecY [Amycolatopsis rubida]NEC58129.1 preprotein translocase subunit SecY [Amycolatopsis rubida]OAP23006.1 Protein translocase subunit SecY [Amycolatopsis sp. M39]SFN93604.1 protein translocase subunit secY/sec61 alpha [Amycolatopsis rubida]